MSSDSAVAKVRHDRSGKVYEVEGIVNNGSEYVCRDTRTKKHLKTDEDGHVVRDEAGKPLIVTEKVTRLKTFSFMEVTRIH